MSPWSVGVPDSEGLHCSICKMAGAEVLKAGSTGVLGCVNSPFEATGYKLRFTGNCCKYLQISDDSCIFLANNINVWEYADRLENSAWKEIIAHKY